MKRKVNAELFVKIAKNIQYLPAIIQNVENWPTYLLYYLGIRKGGAEFVFRNGAIIRDKEGTASGTIAVVFIRKQYGSIADKTTVVEIGANIGTFAIFAATTNTNVRLYSYEPIKANYDVLVANIKRNGYQGRIAAFNCGVASKTESREFYLMSSPEHSLFKGDGFGQGVRVDCVSLNDILSGNSIAKVDLLKINAEGAEYEILYSTPRECFNKIDEIRLEYHELPSDGHNLHDLRSFLEGLGYFMTHLYRYKDDEGFLWMKKTA
jgi:FkbM family methyltransferase